MYTYIQMYMYREYLPGDSLEGVFRTNRARRAGRRWRPPVPQVNSQSRYLSTYLSIYPSLSPSLPTYLPT